MENNTRTVQIKESIRTLRRIHWVLIGGILSPLLFANQKANIPNHFGATFFGGMLIFCGAYLLTKTWKTIPPTFQKEIRVSWWYYITWILILIQAAALFHFWQLEARSIRLDFSGDISMVVLFLVIGTGILAGNEKH